MALESIAPQEAVNRAEDARRILADPVYKASWMAYETRIIEEIANADRTADEAQELRRLLIASRKARAHMERMVREGSMAAHDLNLVERRKKAGLRSFWGT